MIKSLSIPVGAITLSGISALSTHIAPILSLLGVILGCVAAIYAIKNHRAALKELQYKRERRERLRAELSLKDLLEDHPED